MNSKNRNIILGAVVIAVWGLIAFKIVSYFKSSSVVELPATNVFKSAGIKVKRERFALDASYRDPFLNEIKVKTSKSDPYRQIEQVSTKKQVKWPDIRFNGIIESSAKDKKVGILQIDKRVYLVNVGDSAAKVAVIGMFKDSLRLKYSNEIKVYPLQK